MAITPIVILFFVYNYLKYALFHGIYSGFGGLPLALTLIKQKGMLYRAKAKVQR